MKKLMLLVVGLMFTFSANAATLNIVNDIADSAVLVGIVPNNAQDVVASYSNTDGGEYTIGNVVTSDVDTMIKVTWTFNDPDYFTSAAITTGEDSTVFGFGTVIGGAYSFVTSLQAGVAKFFDIQGFSSNPMGVQLAVSAVPVPAALFLFAPALLGFLGLRRRATALAA